jgi:hypothetical protein
MCQLQNFKIQNRLFALLIPLTVAVLTRGILLSRWCSDFNSDEAIVGLMAKHTLEGHFPVFFYGQFYMGSLEAMVAAAIFWLFGDINGLLLRLSPIGFYLAFIIISFIWLDTWYNRLTALWGTLFLALPPPLLMGYSYFASLGYTEMLFLGTLLFFLYQCGSTSGWNFWRVFGLGLVAGLAFWTNPLSILYLITIFAIWTLSSSWWLKWRTFLLKLSFAVIGLALLSIASLALFGLKPAVDVLYIQRLLIGSIFVFWIASITFLRWRSQLNPHQDNYRHNELYAFWLGLGGILGMAPMIYYFFNPGHATGGIDNFSVVTSQRFPQMWQLYIIEIFPALIGLHTYTDSASWLVLLAKTGLAAIFVAVGIFFFKRYRQTFFDIILLRPITPQPEHYLWLLSSLTFGFAFINGNNYVVEHIRYFLPLLFGLSTMVGVALAHWQQSRPVLVIILAVFLWGYYGLTNLHYYQTLSVTCSAQQVADYLIHKHIHGGRAYYQNAYKLTFLTHEQVIIAPYNSRDRYEAYTHYVATLPHQTYILQEGVESATFLSEMGLLPHFTQETINGFNIFTLSEFQ